MIRNIDAEQGPTLNSNLEEGGIADKLHAVVEAIAWQALSNNDLRQEITAELETEIPDKPKLIKWLKTIFESKTGLTGDNKEAFHKWLHFQDENSELPIFFRKYPRLQNVININLSSKIDSLRQRHCQVCKPTNPQQTSSPIFNIVLRIRGRSRQAISPADFQAYQLAIRQYLNKNYAQFPKFENYCLALTFVLNKSRKDRDIDNMSKTIMDAVSRALGFNDAKVSHLDAIKLRLSDAEECVYLRLGPSYVDSNSHDDVAIKELHHVFGVGPPLM